MATVSPINKEVAVGRQHLTMRAEFRHADETGIGQAHGLVGVFAEQAKNIRDQSGKPTLAATDAIDAEFIDVARDGQK